MGGGIFSVDQQTAGADFGWRRPTILALAGVILLIAIVAPDGLFTVDEYFYVRMAEAFAHEGSLSFAQMRIDAPSVSMAFAFPAEGGRLVPQYPAGYAIVAAPFFAVGGVKGLIFLNAISTIAAICFTHGITRRIGGDDAAAIAAILIFILCTFSAVYSFAVWPHMLTVAIASGVIYFSMACGKAVSFFAIGAAIGAACSIRIDAIVLAPAVLIWLRVATIDDNRRKFLACVAGVGLGLAVASALSFAKSGSFNPFAYQNALDQNDPAKFIGAALLIAVVMIAVFAVDMRQAARRLIQNPAFLAAAAVALAIVVALIAEARTLFGGLWTFIVDQQAFAFWDRTPGVERDEFGFLIFFGVAKKALLQSMPFAAVLSLSFLRIFSERLEDRRAALLLIASAGYVGLYALNQTDAGLSFNQRFLTSILPFIAALAAIEFRRISVVADVAPKRAVYVAAAGFVVAAVMLTATLGKAPASSWVEYYAPLVVAAVVFAAIVPVTKSSFNAAAAGRATFVLLFSLGVSAAISGFDFGRTVIFRSLSAAEEARLSALSDQGCLVLTDRPPLWAKRAGEDLSIVYWPILDRKEIERIAMHFAAARRCVYAHGQIAADKAPEGVELSPVPKSEDLVSGPFSRMQTAPPK